MSVFSGKQGKGAMRAHRADKVREAVERQARFDAEVARIAREQNEPMRVARYVARANASFCYRRDSRRAARSVA